ncbi:type IV secretory system conjugative DNA transfer family protein [Paeniglutamicibacter sp. NPDC091659]|uniref:type IV secretory system conjugative DNA transfer family protein n=1 Tax=Paeniglutamicibacter sp. NPDC091659 TaxID=3364389 RepID=UPI003816807E
MNNPLTLALGLMAGDIQWSTAATVVAVALWGLLLTLVFLIAAKVSKKKATRQRGDKSAQFMGRGKDIAELSESRMRAKAKRLGADGKTPGVLLGKVLPASQPIFASFEDMHLDIWGPRRGKTTSRAIPAILEAPGAVVATSNKRDLLDLTRLAREQAGTVWIFDPQGIAKHQPDWWWNPISYVTSWTQAEKLSLQLATAGRDAGAKRDAYFDGSAEHLVALFLFAASLHGGHLIDLHEWITDPTDSKPADILKERGHVGHAASLRNLSTLPDKQRAGVYDTARAMMSFLLNDELMRWVSPSPGVKEFHPDHFVNNGAGTLYLLSQEGHGSGGPIVAALTSAVMEAAENLATESPGGRLAIPLICVLDEAANICKIHQLDSKYSHYGSRGIIILTILQNWVQGELVWGKEGMQKLWDAANVKVYGGGFEDETFMRRMSLFIGDYERISFSESSNGRGGRSRSRSVEVKRILTESELRELPRFRMVIFYSGLPPMLVQSVPFFDTKHAQIVEASRLKYDPAIAAS